MATVILNNVSKTYPGGVQAARDLSLQIQDGEFLVLVGPSGCGKTTLLRMVAGLETITSGTITIGDRVINEVPPKDRDIAMVFQNYALYPHMTVRKNLEFGLKLRKVPRPTRQARVSEVAAQLGLDELLERKPSQLSGGQQQRVALGRAMIRQPSCFLFDEPLSNLDAKLRMQMRAEIKLLQQRVKTTAIYVTHDQEEAMTLGDRIVIMNHGLIQQVGSPLEVYGRPANRFVATFIGSPPMNILHGSSDGQGRWSSEGGTVFQVGSLADAATGPSDLGFRPEQVQLCEPGTSGAIESTLTLAEPLGDRVDLALKTAADESITARVPMFEIPAPGQPISFTIDPEKAHLFEPGPDGARLD